MKNCLVTKLKEAIEDPNLDKFNCINLTMTGSEIRHFKIDPKNIPYSITGNANRVNTDGTPYGNDGGKLAIDNYFLGSGTYKIHLSKSIVPNGRLVVDKNVSVPLSNLFETEITSIEISQNGHIDGDLMDIGKVNTSLSTLLFQKNSDYYCSTNRIEDFLSSYNHDNGTLEFYFSADTSYVVDKMLFNGVQLTTRHIATYSDSSIVVTEKTSGNVIGTYTKETGVWTYQ